MTKNDTQNHRETALAAEQRRSRHIHMQEWFMRRILAKTNELRNCASAVDALANMELDFTVPLKILRRHTKELRKLLKEKPEGGE